MTQDQNTSARRRRSLAVAGSLAGAIAAVVAIALGGGSSNGGIGPSDALADVAQNTAGVSSGVARATITASGGGDPIDIAVRFDGDDAEVTFDEILENGTVRERVVRSVAGNSYEQDADGTWTALEGGSGNVLDVVRGDIANDALVKAVQSASDVTRDGDVYKATLGAEQAAVLEGTLVGLGDSPLAEGVAVEVQAGTDNLIHRVSFVTGGVTRTITYSELGQPQEITAPEVAPAG